MEGYICSFMVTISDQNKKQLKIPIQVMNRLIGIRNPAKIRRKNTFRVWDVTLREYQHVERRGAKLCEGWNECRLENDANLGDDVVFEYAGNSVFTISVLSGRDGIPKFMSPGLPPMRSQIRGQVPQADDDGESSCLANCFVSNSKYPSFKVMLTKAYMKSGLLNIPFQFAVAHLPEEQYNPGTVRVRGARWEIAVSLYYRQGRAYNCKISSGFIDVIERARLRRGQILAFELLRAKPVKFRVAVFGPDN